MPREPPSASTTSRRLDARDAGVTERSQNGLARAGHDATPLLAAHPLVLRRLADPVEVDVPELEPAPAAPAVPHLGGGQSAAARPDLLVEGDEVLADPGNDGAPPRPDLARLGIRCGEGGIALFLERLEPLHE